MRRPTLYPPPPRAPLSRPDPTSRWWTAVPRLPELRLPIRDPDVILRLRRGRRPPLAD